LHDGMGFVQWHVCTVIQEWRDLAASAFLSEAPARRDGGYLELACLPD
jgi:hypothetical protein